MTSVAEWIVSANSVGEPVVTNAKNFEPVMRLLVTIDMVTDFNTSFGQSADSVQSAGSHASIAWAASSCAQTALPSKEEAAINPIMSQ